MANPPRKVAVENALESFIMLENTCVRQLMKPQDGRAYERKVRGDK